MAARELGRLSLMDALSLVVLYARVSSPKFEPAAVRWLARLALEGRDIGLADVRGSACLPSWIASRAGREDAAHAALGSGRLCARNEQLTR